MTVPGTSPNPAKYVLAFSLPLAALVATASLGGLLRPEYYRLETADWTIQSAAQDVVDLFLVVPVLTIAGLFVYRGERLAEPIWGGTLLYLVYTFIIYCFAVHFNQLFLVYVAALGLSAWGAVYFFRFQQRRPTILRLLTPTVGRVVGIYFLLVAALFCALWLSEIIPTMWTGERPATLITAGLVTNPVHVLDLSVVLPGIFLTGLLLLKTQPSGLVFAPVLLVFFILMDITIAVIFLAQDAGKNLAGALVMLVLAIWSLTALLWLLRRSVG